MTLFVHRPAQAAFQSLRGMMPKFPTVACSSQAHGATDPVVRVERQCTLTHAPRPYQTQRQRQSERRVPLDGVLLQRPAHVQQHLAYRRRLLS
jgi:hypothetical protein